MAYMKDAARKTFAKKGDAVVNMNLAAVDAGINSPIRVTVPEAWKYAEEEAQDNSNLPEMIRDIVIPVNAQRGDSLPVSTFVGHEGGTFTMGVGLREAGHCHPSACLGSGKMYPVQPLRVCLPACGYSPVSAE